MGARLNCNSTLQGHPMADEDQVHIFVVLWLNAFPVKNGILVTYSPQELLVHWKLDYNKHCWVLPGTYCEAHDKPVPSNTMIPHTHETIALRPSGNL
jgi:hypothetical protein